MRSRKHWYNFSEKSFKIYRLEKFCTATQKEAVIVILGGTEERPVTLNDIPDEMLR